MPEGRLNKPEFALGLELATRGRGEVVEGTCPAGIDPNESGPKMKTSSRAAST